MQTERPVNPSNYVDRMNRTLSCFGIEIPTEMNLIVPGYEQDIAATLPEAFRHYNLAVPEGDNLVLFPQFPDVIASHAFLGFLGGVEVNHKDIGILYVTPRDPAELLGFTDIDDLASAQIAAIDHLKGKGYKNVISIVEDTKVTARMASYRGLPELLNKLEALSEKDAFHSEHIDMGSNRIMPAIVNHALKRVNGEWGKFRMYQNARKRNLGIQATLLELSR